MIKSIPIFITFLFFVIGTQARWDGKLKFKDNKFTILQITDLHFGDSTIQDIRNMGIQSYLIQTVKPDLVVMTGDMFSGYSDPCHTNPPYPECYKNYGWFKYTYTLKMLGQKYSIILGNHDSQADLTRKEIVELDMTSNLSLTNTSPDGVSPGSNYYLPIYDENEEHIESLLWMFDSHDEGCEGFASSWGCVESDQIGWFNEEYQNILNAENKEAIEGLSFVHIPPPEYVELINNFEITGHFREEMCCPCNNTGFVDALMKNHVLANFVGHDHDNDFAGTYQKNGNSIELFYGRKSGFGSYGPPAEMNKGATVITLTSLGNGKISVDTYIQDEAGHQIPRGQPYRSPMKAQQCHC